MYLPTFGGARNGRTSGESGRPPHCLQPRRYATDRPTRLTHTLPHRAYPRTRTWPPTQSPLSHTRTGRKVSTLQSGPRNVLAAGRRAACGRAVACGGHMQSLAAQLGRLRPHPAPPQRLRGPYARAQRQRCERAASAAPRAWILSAIDLGVEGHVFGRAPTARGCRCAPRPSTCGATGGAGSVPSVHAACNILAGGRGARPSSARRGRHANKDRASVRVGRVDSPRRAPPGGGSRAPPPTRTRRPPSHARWRQPASGPRVGSAGIAWPSWLSSATRCRPSAGPTTAAAAKRPHIAVHTHTRVNPFPSLTPLNGVRA